MELPKKPKPPHCRKFKGYKWVNEAELVDWYTDIGLTYPENFSKLTLFFNPALKKAIIRNKEINK